MNGPDVDYARLIARHLESRMRAFPRDEIDRMLGIAGLQWTDSVVSTRLGIARVDANLALRYKQAVREVFGEVAYGMTRANFLMAGCRCEDCQQELQDT